MRRRKVKGADEKLMSFTDYVIKGEEIDFNGKWNEKFENNNPIHVEFGSGRGKFITTLAKENPQINFIAMEIKEEVLVKGVEKAFENDLDNVLFVWGDVNKIEEYFDKEELSRVYVNFCDPWPKSRWAKRRLTHRNFLEKYKSLLKEDGQICFKTDNEKLFEFSLNEFSEANLKLKNITLNLVESNFEENVTTEYEEKFMSQGMKIFRVEGHIKK